MAHHDLTTWYDPATKLHVLGWLDMDVDSDDNVACFTFTNDRDALIARDVLRATEAQKPKPADQVEYDRLIALGWSRRDAARHVRAMVEMQR